MIGNGVLALLRNPEQLALLREEPKRIEAAVEEMLRYDGTVQLTSRFATRDGQIAGRPVKKGMQLALMLAAANRDPEVFDHPDEFRLDRDLDELRRRHVAFGVGHHFCPGFRCHVETVQGQLQAFGP